MEFNICRNVLNTLKVEDIGDANTHVCVTPGRNYVTPDDDNSCSKCLTGTSSVLQLERPDGSYCVGGIATPTTNECNVNDVSDPLYYTLLLDSTIKNYISPVFRVLLHSNQIQI